MIPKICGVCKQAITKENIKKTGVQFLKNKPVLICYQHECGANYSERVKDEYKDSNKTSK